MDLNYVYSESTVKPQEIEACKTTVYFRKDIKTEERTYGDLTQTFYVYQEAKMPIEEFKRIANNQVFVNAVKGANDSEKIDDIKTKSVDSQDNQLIIMEAIADLYERIASISGGTSK